MAEPRIVRVFPRRTSYTPKDELAFIGDPPMLPFRPYRDEVDEVHVSVAFTWDIAEGRRLAAAWAKYFRVVKLGGPALGEAGNGFTPGLYVKPGVVFTSRGCNNRCPWCLVPWREGRLRLLPIQDGWVIQDNNFLQCPREHRLAVYRMLGRQRYGAVFSGGIDARLVNDEIAAEFRDLRIAAVFLAADTDAALRPLESAVQRLAFLGRRKLRCYVMVGYGGETIEQAERRLRAVWEIGAMPFCQLYQPPDRYIRYDCEWRELQRTWSRPAATKAAARSALEVYYD